MRLNVDTLGTFYEMARQGSGLAAERLTDLTGVESRVAATRIEFTTPAAVRSELRPDDGRPGTVVDLAGGVEGQTILAFDADAAREVATALVEDTGRDRPTDGLVESAVPEFCAIMNNGFVDGWANVLDREVELSTPRYVPGESLAGAVDVDAVDGVAVLFRSRIEAHATELSFGHYFLPSARSTRELFAADGGIAYEKLAGFDRVAQRGADRVTDDLSALTGIETTVDVRRVSFLALDAIPSAVPNERVASVAFSFAGTPSGYLLFLYDRASARRLARTMTERASLPSEGLGEMGRDALQEASNIMASGLLDGWANALETTIEHTTPSFAWDMGPATVDPLVVALSERQEFAFVFDTRIEADDRSFDASVYVIPDEADLEQAVDAVDTDRVETARPTADVDVGDLDESDLSDVEEVTGVSVE